MIIDCNRIAVAGPKLEFIRRSCYRCKINPGLCAINDLLRDTGVLETWQKLKAPNYRERKHGTKRSDGQRD